MNDKEREEYRRGFEKAHNDTRKRIKIFLWINAVISATAFIIAGIAVIGKILNLH